MEDLDNCIINSYDLLIVGVALVGKYALIHRLIIDLNYRNCLIIDKPLSIDRKELKNYKILLNSLKSYAVVCQRDFDEAYYNIPFSNSYYITWYSLTEELSVNIVDRMPHLLSWLIQKIGSNIHLKIQDNFIYGTIENCPLEIHFEKTGDYGIEVNQIWYESPDYRKLNRKIVEKVYCYRKEDSMKNFNRAVVVSKLLCDLLEAQSDI